MPADASGLTDDAAALLSVWVMVKDGGTWGAPGPPPWVVNKISRDKGTLVMGAPDERTSAAFRDAGITISGPADEPSIPTKFPPFVVDHHGIRCGDTLMDLPSVVALLTEQRRVNIEMRAALDLRERQMALAAKYIARFYEMDRNDCAKQADVDHARQMVFAIGADLKRILEEKDEADYQNDLARGGGYAKEQADAK